MARWNDGSIIWKVESGSLTTDFADNHNEAYNIRNGWLVFYVKYVKGSENYVELQLYFDNSNRLQLAEEAEEEGGVYTPEWYAVSCDGYWPAEGNFAAQLSTYVGVRALPWRFEASGEYRILFPALPREDAFRLAVRGQSAGDGVVTVRYAADDIQWGMVGQGAE